MAHGRHSFEYFTEKPKPGRHARRTLRRYLEALAIGPIVVCVSLFSLYKAEKAGAA